MITVKQIIRALRAGELKEYSLANQAFENLEALNRVIDLINLAIIEINKDMFMSREYYTLKYTKDEDTYEVCVCNLEKILGVYDEQGNDFRLNSSAFFSKDDTLRKYGEMIVYTTSYNTLYFPFELCKDQDVKVLCRTSLCNVDYAFSLEEGFSKVIKLPSVFLEAIINYVSYKVLKGVSSTGQGQPNPSQENGALYERSIAKLRDQGYGNELTFNTDKLFLNSTFY